MFLMFSIGLEFSLSKLVAMRRMVLGPLEFCLQSPVPVELPELVRGLTVALRPNGSAPS